ncbi:hypothetical protein FGB62_128g136 [Gracilaria domingensis]|nr:hypothetical protein FGB62_128g136 [Gracilaria domingensis]
MKRKPGQSAFPAPDQPPPPPPNPSGQPGFSEGAHGALPNPNLLDSLLNISGSQGPKSHNQNTKAIGGIVIIDADGKSTAQRPPDLSAYPGKGTSLPKLGVKELKGGEILQSFLQRGSSLVSVVRDIQWQKGDNGEILASEAEAHTLARMIHLYLLENDTIRAALEEKGAWLEVELRRLFALQYVERLCGTMGATRRQAWEMVMPVLEIFPTAAASLPEMENKLMRQFAPNVKAEASLATARSDRKNSRWKKRRRGKQPDQQQAFQAQNPKPQ